MFQGAVMRCGRSLQDKLNSLAAVGRVDEGGHWEEEGGRCRGPVTGGGLLWLLGTSERHGVVGAEAGVSVPALPHLV